MNDVLRDSLDILNAAGIKPSVHRGKHTKVSWYDPTGRRRILVVSASPSSRNAIYANRTVLRRLLGGRP
jgi:hypothetical protein